MNSRTFLKLKSNIYWARTTVWICRGCRQEGSTKEKSSVSQKIMRTVGLCRREGAMPVTCVTALPKMGFRDRIHFWDKCFDKAGMGIGIIPPAVPVSPGRTTHWHRGEGSKQRAEFLDIAPLCRGHGTQGEAPFCLNKNKYSSSWSPGNVDFSPHRCLISVDTWEFNFYVFFFFCQGLVCCPG